MSGHQDGGPAFPHKPTRSQHAGAGGWEIVTPGDYPGMSLRQYIAIKAMQAMIAAEYAGKYDPIRWTCKAYEMADHMLEAGTK